MRRTRLLVTYSAPESFLRGSRVETHAVVPIDENALLPRVRLHDEDVVRTDIAVHDARFLEGVRIRFTAAVSNLYVYSKQVRITFHCVR